MADEVDQFINAVREMNLAERIALETAALLLQQMRGLSPIARNYTVEVLNRVITEDSKNHNSHSHPEESRP